ncbi:MAG: hypothetical protein LBG58_03425 [Planctomycetaceae bacterium]|nr:hypothetical protein [Planctomycetaceae bacterium]
MENFPIRIPRRSFIKTATSALALPMVVTSLSIVQGQDKKSNLPRFAVISDTHFGSNRGLGAMTKVPNPHISCPF